MDPHIAGLTKRVASKHEIKIELFVLKLTCNYKSKYLLDIVIFSHTYTLTHWFCLVIVFLYFKPSRILSYCHLKSCILLLRFLLKINRFILPFYSTLKAPLLCYHFNHYLLTQSPQSSLRLVPRFHLCSASFLQGGSCTYRHMGGQS